MRVTVEITRLSDEQWAALLVLLRSTGTYCKRAGSSTGLETHIVELSEHDENLEWLLGFHNLFGFLDVPYEAKHMSVHVGKQKGSLSLQETVYRAFPHLRPNGTSIAIDDGPAI